MISEQEQLHLYKKELKTIEQQLAAVLYEIDHDPRKMLFDVHVRFNDFLKKTEGKGLRTTKEAMAEFAIISADHNKAKKALRNFSVDGYSKIFEKRVDLQIKRDNYASDVAMIEWRINYKKNG